MKVLITGGCGFIGSHLAEFHLEKGDEVHVVDNLSTGRLENISEASQKNPAFKFDQADLRTWDGLSQAVAQADRVYHMAAVVGVFKVLSDPIEVIETNIEAFKRLLDAASESPKKPRIILASSSSVYGNSPKPLMSEDDELLIKTVSYSLSTYAVSKLAGETYALGYFNARNVPITIVRLFNAIGPRQSERYGMVVPRFIKQALSGEPLTIFGDGNQMRSFCDVRDSIVAMDALASLDNTIGEVINVGNDYEITINDLAKLVCKLTQSNSDHVYISYKEAYGDDFIDISQRRPNLEKLKKLANFKHAWTLEKTLLNLIKSS